MRTSDECPPSNESVKTDIDKRAVVSIYRFWAPIYDLVFGAVFERGRKTAIAAAERIGGRVLEVGVGTGLSLPFYTERCRITGIDLSEEMLEKARRRVAEQRLTGVERLEIMDAERLDIPDESFDVVVAMCVVNTVPHPQQALAEFARVVKPGGEIILLNRVGADSGARLLFEKLFQPIASRLGWRSEFPWSRFDEWLAASPYSLRVIERRPVPPFGHFSVIRFGKAAVDTPTGAPHRNSTKPEPVNA